MGSGSAASHLYTLQCAVSSEVFRACKRVGLPEISYPGQTLRCSF